MSNDRVGELYVVAAPSGAGKTSLIRRMLEAFPDLAFSVSATTRPPRRGEADGEHYHFLERGEFQDRVEQGRFLEHAEVFGHFYGTDRRHVETLWADGKDVLLDIDVQGAAQVRATHPDACQVFILPPSLAVLRERLTGRNTDAPEVIERRLREARDEMAGCLAFDWIVVNDDFEQACAEMRAILTAWPLRRERQRSAQSDRIRNLLARGANGDTIEG
ncbi:MAG: guanylate kinase [Wenzhouxiangellaceae bacterium]|nr:guanylate kinase [Wenzhouxiangellaceae bacterium]